MLDDFLGSIHSFQGLWSTGYYMNQVASLSTSPRMSFTVAGRENLVDLIMSLLTNPYFYAVIGVIIIMSILPTFDD